MCLEHQVAPQVVMEDGSVTRFCQRCHSLHAVSEFDGELRTCKTSLAKHNARRRQRKTRTAANVASGLERIGSDTRGGSSAGRASGSDSHDAAAAPSPVGETARATLMLRPRGADAADLGAALRAVLALERFTVEVKLPNCPTPASLPPGDVLRAALGESLESVIDTACVSIAPGCVRLIIDGMMGRHHLSTAEAAAQTQAMAQQLAVMLRRHGGAAAGARVVGLCDEVAPRSLFPLSALLMPPASDDAGMVTLPATCALPAGAAHLAVRCWGRDVRCNIDASGRVTLQLGAVPYAGGCLLVEARSSDGQRMHRPRAVVASRDPALVAELNDTYLSSALLSDDEDMQAVLHVLGDALTPHGTWEVQCAAAKAAAILGWGAALRELCSVADSYNAGYGDELAVVASSHAMSASSASAMYARAPAAAWADAASRLQSALSDDTFELPHLAAYCALRMARSDAGASQDVVRLLQAVSAVLLRDAEDDVDLALDEEDEAAETAAYEAFRALYCAHEHFITHALGLLGFLLRLQKAVVAMGRESWPTDAEMGPSAAALMRGFRLHPLASGAPLVEPRSLPWPAVVRSLQVFVGYSILVLLPCHLLGFYFSWRLVHGRRAPSARVYYAVLCYVNCWEYCTNNLVGDLCILHAAGAAPEWPVGPPTLLHSFFILWVWRKALFTPALERMTMAFTALSSFGPLLYVAGPRVVFGNAANALLAATILFTAVRAGGLERKLKAKFAASRMRSVGKAKQA